MRMRTRYRIICDGKRYRLQYSYLGLMWSICSSNCGGFWESDSLKRAQEEIERIKQREERLRRPWKVCGEEYIIERSIL
jgi:hypothetical protein